MAHYLLLWNAFYLLVLMVQYAQVGNFLINVYVFYISRSMYTCTYLYVQHNNEDIIIYNALRCKEDGENVNLAAYGLFTEVFGYIPLAY